MNKNSLNGDVINAITLKNEKKYSYKFTEMKFLSKWNSYFAISDSEGNIFIYDAFSFEVNFLFVFCNKIKIFA